MVEAAEPPVPPVPTSASNRRVSAPVLRGMSLSDEPEDMYAIREEDVGEGADAWVHAQEEETLDDEDLPYWAKRELFVGDEIGARLFSFHTQSAEKQLTTRL